jgi:SAM-dependent methyltransferase
LDHSTNSKVFDEYGRYYDLLYYRKDYRAEADYLVRMLTRLGVPHGALLEFGAGTGRHGRLLAQADYNVHGIELSEVMVERARLMEPQPGFSIMVGDIRTTRVPRQFDAVMALFHVMSYQTTNADVLAVFRNARAHLSQGGIFIFDVWYGPAVMTLKPSAREMQVEDDNISVVRQAKPDWDINRNQVDVHYAIKVKRKATGESFAFKEVHPMRYFSLPELDVFAEIAGFRREFAEEFMSGANLSTDTWGACVALRAI